MTKAIEDELGLPRLEDALRDMAESTESSEGSDVSFESIERMADALQNVNPSSFTDRDPTGVNEHISESEDIMSLALKAHKDLMDLGFNIEPKNAGANAFAPSAKFLELALKASQSKADRKMEHIRMVMDKERHKKEMGEGIEDGEIVESGSSIIANRNDIMEKIRKGEI